MGWYESGGFTVRQDPMASGADARFRVTFYGAEDAGTHRIGEHVTKTDLLGMRREISRALKAAETNVREG